MYRFRLIDAAYIIGSVITFLADQTTGTDGTDGTISKEYILGFSRDQIDGTYMYTKR